VLDMIVRVWPGRKKDDGLRRRKKEERVKRVGGVLGGV
jgi:hypothetical protein